MIEVDADDASMVPSSSTINFNTPTGNNEWYYVRINGVTAPSIAGKYFFKMFLAAPGGSSNAPSSNQLIYWLPTQNWPVLLVKGELDPAIITGTIRYGGYNSSLYGQPIMEAGMVTAVMKTKLDPYTGNSLVDCTKASNPMAVGCTNAVAYFNGTSGTLAHPLLGSDGHYEVEGVAPGVYDLYA